MNLTAYQPPQLPWQGIDTAGDDDSPGNVITPELGRELYAAGIRWVARYTRPDGVVLDNPKPGGDWQGCYSMSIAESRWILEAGLMPVPVQFGIFGDDARASAAGRAMAQTHRLLGFPAGVHHYFDVEGGRPKGAGRPACRSYIETAAAAALAGGASAPRCGLYHDDLPLSGHQLYQLAGITSYWAACGPTPPVVYYRGPSILQRLPGEMCGLKCDRDVMIPDGTESMPVLVATPEIVAAMESEAIGRLMARLPVA